MMAEDQGPAWGGIGGRPRRMGGDGAAVGSGDQSSAQATIITGSKDKAQKANPLLDLLEKKILPEGEMAQPRSGLLYFLLEGKHKPKDLELIYKSPAGKVSVRFR